MITFTVQTIAAAVARIHDQIRDEVVAACELSEHRLADIAHDGAGDTIYEVDRVSEEALIRLVNSEIACHEAVELIAEGIEPDGSVILPAGTEPSEIRWRLLIDPIDGTRGLMYQKRSAWILTAIAAATGVTLRDCVAAVMTEIPLNKQHRSDQLAAVRGSGVKALRYDRLSGERRDLVVKPSDSDTLAHGFAQISRFFPGDRAALAAIDDELMQAVCGPAAPGKALCFEDQYLSTGGQFYELIVGHDRFCADLRPLFGSGGLCCHPYDCAGLLIAEEAGVIITGADGQPFDAPLDIHADVAWAGYANAALRQQIEPALQSALRRRGLLAAGVTSGPNAEISNTMRGDVLWQPGRSLHIARAPGRLDFLGGIADYSGALVLQLPLAEQCHAAVQLSGDDRISLVSEIDGVRDEVELSWSELGNLDPVQLKTNLEDNWAAYIVGVAAVLMQEYGLPPSGFRALLHSTVPPGKGVSSSAAIEVATLRALASAFGLALDGVTLATLAQRAENQIVGAACGIMDQMTSACGRTGQLLALNCQPAVVEGYFSLPENVAIWGIDSGSRHAVAGADYSAVRCAAFMGLRMLAESAPAGMVEGWNGWLANVTPSQWSALSSEIPAAISGAEFLAQWGGTDDPLSEVDPQRSYRINACTAHPVFENHRIRCAAALLQAPAGEATARLLGEIMYQAHASYSHCGLGSPATDALVAAVRTRAAAGEPLYGAKITGGGSGGTVAILAAAGAGEAVREIAAEHAAQWGGGYVFADSGEGAVQSAVQVFDL